jgi:ABC-type branched-subunit amino acid transport system ATPase component
MKLIEVKKLTKRFSGLVAVNNVDFYINGGEIFGLIGPNGSGKTVMFNTITGLYKSNGGKVFFSGEDITDLPPHVINEKGIGRTFQGSKVFLGLTPLQNVMVGRHCRTRSHLGSAIIRTPFTREEERDTEEKAMRVIELVGMGLVERKDTPIKDLTYVMRSLTGIAIALATDPKIIFLDEPIAGMNPTEIVQSMELIKRIRDTGITVFLVEHNMKAIMGICERIMVLNMGYKIAEGTPQEISRNEEVVQAYLGRKYGAEVK